MQLQTSFKSVLSTFVFIQLVIVGLLPLTASASSVTGKYVKISANTIILELSVSKPAPSSIILKHSFSKNNKVVSTSPKAKKISNNGEVKWLISNIRPGKKRFTLQLATPLKGSVHAVLRYRDPVNGQFTEKNINP